MIDFIDNYIFLNSPYLILLLFPTPLILYKTKPILKNERKVEKLAMKERITKTHIKKTSDEIMIAFFIGQRKTKIQNYSYVIKF